MNEQLWWYIARSTGIAPQMDRSAIPSRSASMFFGLGGSAGHSPGKVRALSA